MLSPGSAYLLAYLPARRVAYVARQELLDRNAATIDAALKHALTFSRAALEVEESLVAECDARFTDTAAKSGVSIPAMPAASDMPKWLEGLSGHVRSHLTTPVLEAAWNAGETARLVSISAQLLAHLAYLRNAAPNNVDLRVQAEQVARDLKESATQLTADLHATGLPLVKSQADNVAKMVNLTRDLTPTSVGGYKQLNELTRDVDNFIQLKVRQLDAAPPTPASAPATDEEKAILARILETPSDRKLRRELAALAERRNDERAKLIRIQLDGDGDERAAQDLIRSHPEWSARLLELGARDIKFAGGFPDAITVDAGVFLSRGADLLAAAPITKLKIRDAAGRVGDVVRSKLLATIETLDLDDQAVTDDDVAALATSSHASRLRQLDLRHNPLTERGIEAIAASPYLKDLEVVNLDGNPADPVDRVEHYDETSTHAVPTEAGKALEAKYGRLRWLRRR